MYLFAINTDADVLLYLPLILPEIGATLFWLWRRDKSKYPWPTKLRSSHLTARLQQRGLLVKTKQVPAHTVLRLIQRGVTMCLLLPY